MAGTDKKMSKDANLAKECIELRLGTSATSQTDKFTDRAVPGFAFEVVKVEVYALTVTATITADVTIGTASVLTGAVTPVADTVTAGTLSTTLASRRGSSTAELRVKYTSNGTGAATNLVARVWIRPQAMNGDAAL